MLNKFKTFLIYSQNKVPIFLETVIEIQFLSCIIARSLLKAIVKIHMQKNGIADNQAF